MTTIVTGMAQARLGLLGNPSDGFGGRVIATTIADFEATVIAEPAPAWTIDAAPDVQAGSIRGLCAQMSELTGGAELVAAALTRLVIDQPELHDSAPFRLGFTTTIPRSVGLAGSSAIILATLRAVAAATGLEPAPADLARMAWEAETDVLGWTAGPQDRVVQACGGVVDMDFAEGWRPSAWQPIAAAELPSLVMAWDTRSAAASDIVHRDVRSRWEEGDREVVDAMRRFASLAEAGRGALDAGAAAERWPDLVDDAYELRRRFWHLNDRDEALVAIAREHRIGASLAGSGGAIVGVPRDRGRIDGFLEAVRSIGADAIVPTIGAPVEGSR